MIRRKLGIIAASLAIGCAEASIPDCTYADDLQV
jgi:hypothetical protein